MFFELLCIQIQFLEYFLLISIVFYIEKLSSIFKLSILSPVVIIILDYVPGIVLLYKMKMMFDEKIMKINSIYFS